MLLICVGLLSSWSGSPTTMNVTSKSVGQSDYSPPHFTPLHSTITHCQIPCKEITEPCQILKGEKSAQSK